MMRRFAAALVLALGLAACKENDNAPLSQQFFQGQADVRVIDARIVPSGDASAQTSGGTLRYVIARIEFTNDTGYELTPDISRFYLIDRNYNRYQAKDSGSSVFTGISNSTQPLKVNEKREYTIGFRTTDPNVSGTIYYEK